MSVWLIPYKDLTPEQQKAIEISPDEHRVIFGEPGSGKTQVLLHRARYLRDRYKIQPGKFIIFVYTNVLRQYIQSALAQLDLPQDSCTTWESWCFKFYQQHISNRIPFLAGERVPDYEKIHRDILATLKSSKVKTPLFDFIMVDEGQDLDALSYEILKQIAVHVTVCMDHKQQIFEQGTTEKNILKKLEIKSKNISLLQGYRCNPFVSKLASEYIPNSKDRMQFIAQAKALKAEKELPLLYLAQGFDDEKRRLIEMVKLRKNKGENVAVIFPQKKMVFGFAEGFHEAKLEVEALNNLDFSSYLPKLLTYQSAKGLTFDSVFLPRLVPWSFRKVENERLEKLLFVAITRAKKWIYLSTYKGRELELIKKMRSLESKGLLVVQEYNTVYDHGVTYNGEEVSNSGESGDILELF
jgi:superfamily I DNA/RNA helicase